MIFLNGVCLVNVKNIFLSGSIVFLLVACDSGDITLAPSTVDNSTGSNTTTTSDNNPCAKYTEAGQTYQGTVDANGHCLYTSSFVSSTNPITVSAITFPALSAGKYHLFDDALYIGEDVNANAAATGKRIPQEAEGTRLNIVAGNTMVFKQAQGYVRIARGSQIYAEGTKTSPIIFTSDEDAILGTATESSRGDWGGIQINGNGKTNKCHDGTSTGSGSGSTSQYAATSNNVHNCHVTAEGKPATYGGNNQAENSGVLKYVVIKHAGFEVVDGDELNALTLNGVGSGTTIDHVQVYTSQDDGFEMFGGAVNLTHIVAVNVGDDSIDYSEGYQGSIQYAVVVHTSGSNRCIEGDNTGGSRADDITPLTMLKISNMTCITSGIDKNKGINTTSKGDSEGPLFREGAHFEIYNSIVTSNAAAMASNECFELDDTEGPQTIDAAQAGTSKAKSNVIACTEPLKAGADTANNGFDNAQLATWLAGGAGTTLNPTNSNTNNVVITTTTSSGPAASLITDGVGKRGYLTAATITNTSGATAFDQSTQLFAANSLGGIFVTPTYLGGANAGDDWLAGWTVGLSAALNP
jgi:hypothetical protein